MSLFVQQNQTICDFSNSDSWVILSPIEQSIKRKIEAVGTPLKDWDVRINYGIKTGYNDAFIITSEKREEILTNCKDGDERKRTVELIRPILRGRDIKRYCYEDSGLYLINTHNGIKGKLPRIKIEDFPAVKAHLDQYWDKIKDRADQGDTPYNLRNCAYLEDFSQPKLVWAELARSGNAFVIDFTKKMVGNTGYILTVHDNNEDSLYYLLGFLNSRVILYCLNQITSRFDENGWRWLRQFVEQLRIPKGDNFNSIVGIAKSTNINNQNVKSEEINVLVAEYFGLTEKEYRYICDHLKGY